jgi:hypothetical protein
MELGSARWLGFLERASVLPHDLQDLLICGERPIGLRHVCQRLLAAYRTSRKNGTYDRL